MVDMQDKLLENDLMREVVIPADHIEGSLLVVIFGGMIGYSSDDINKFLWMVRISGGVFPRIVESNYYNARGQYAMDASVSDTMKNSIMYKMCYYRFCQV